MSESENDEYGGAIDHFEVTGVTWTDDDGTTYERTISDGEIVNKEVSA